MIVAYLSRGLAEFMKTTLHTLIVGLLCSGSIASCENNKESGGNFQVSFIHEARQSVYGLAVGDFDPRHKGQEIAALTADSGVLELYYKDGNWREEVISTGDLKIQDPSQRPTIDVGNVDPRFPGSEIVLSSSFSIADLNQVFYAQKSGWGRERLIDQEPPIDNPWGARVGDVDPGRPGEEVFYIVEGGALDFCNAWALHRTEEAGWKGYGEDSVVFHGEVGMDSAIGDIDPAWPGNEVVIATEMGPTYQLFPPQEPHQGVWKRRLLWDDEKNAGWVVKIADIDPDLEGNEVAYGTRYNNRITLSHRDPNGDGAHTLKILCTGEAGPTNMLDIAVGDLFPSSPSLEICGVDETGRVYVVSKGANGWESQIAFHNPDDSLYAVVMGEFTGSERGVVIVAVGRSGAIYLLRPVPE